MNGLHYRPLAFPLSILSVSDASFATKATSYAQEAEGVLLATDDLVYDITRDTVPFSETHKFAGYLHTLSSGASKSKRISHSTSHVETNAAERFQNSAHLAALRLTEFRASCMFRQPPSFSLLLRTQEQGQFLVPCDSIADCMDLWELASGLRGIPSDNSASCVFEHP